MAKKQTKSAASADALKRKIWEMQAAHDAGKAGYNKADELLQEIVPLLKLGESIDLGNGEQAELVDNFAKKNKAWKPCGINRWDIKVTRAKLPAAPPVNGNDPTGTTAAER